MRDNTTIKFKLAELLEAVAIIGVLVAISIPIFTGQLEKAREATDAANIRAAYASVSTDVLLDPQNATEDANGVTYDKVKKTYTATVAATQKEAGWQTDSIKNDGIGGQKVAAQVGTSWTITGDVATGKVAITSAATE